MQGLVEICRPSSLLVKMKYYSRLLAAVIKQVLRPRRRKLTTSALLLVIFASISFVVFDVDQLSQSPPDLADVDIQVVVIEEHHEGTATEPVATANSRSTTFF